MQHSTVSHVFILQLDVVKMSLHRKLQEKMKGVIEIGWGRCWGRREEKVWEEVEVGRKEEVGAKEEKGWLGEDKKGEGVKKRKREKED